MFRLALSKLFPFFWKQERTVPTIHKLVSLDENYLCFSSSKQALPNLTGQKLLGTSNTIFNLLRLVQRS